MARVEAVGWVVGERNYSFAAGHRSRVRSPGQRAPRRCNVEGGGLVPSKPRRYRRSYAPNCLQLTRRGVAGG